MKQACKVRTRSHTYRRMKKAAIKQMLAGESIRNYDLWTADGMHYDKLILKLKDYARNKQLDGEAQKGKQAVVIGHVQHWAEEVPLDTWPKNARSGNPPRDIRER